MKFFAAATEEFLEYLEDYPEDLEEVDFVLKSTNRNVQRSLMGVLRSMIFSVPRVGLTVPSGDGLGVKFFDGSGGVPLDINARAASGPGTLMILMGPTLGGEEVEFFITLTGQEQYGNVEVFNNINFDPGQRWVPEQIKALSLGADLYLWWHDLYGKCLATAFVALGTSGLAADLEGFAPSLNQTWQSLVDQIERIWESS